MLVFQKYILMRLNDISYGNIRRPIQVSQLPKTSRPIYYAIIECVNLFYENNLMLC